LTETLAAPTSGDGLLVNKQHIAFELDGGIAERAAIGVIVLGSDQTIEHEFRRILDLPGVAFYESRIHNANNINPETLKAMETSIADCAARILPGLPLDVVAYGCTSGAMVIGDDKVAARIHEARPGVACSTPMAAAFAAFKALGCSRIALLTPYIDEINQAMRAHLKAGGLDVPVMGSFNEGDDRKVGRISPDSLRRAALELGASEAVEAVFVSCTALRLVEVATEIEAALGKPVTSSNHALAWHCLRLASVDDPLPHFGRLFTCALA
jgi:maleate isomerase